MKTIISTASALILVLSACDGKTSDANSTGSAAAEPSAVQLHAQINKAYMDNAMQAQRTWGGKHVTVGGAFDSSGRNSDGTTSILLTAGDTQPTIGEFNVGKGRDDFVANLKKGDPVALKCTVDPKNEGFAVSYMACTPAARKR